MLSEKIKKFLKIGIFVIIVLALASAIYFMFFRGTTTTTPVDLEPQTTLPINQQLGQLPNSIVGNVNQEASLGGLDQELTSDISLLPEGKVTPFQDSTLTTERALETQALSPKATGSGVNYYSPVADRFYKLTNTGDSQELSPTSFYNVEQATWSKDGNKAVLEYPDGANVIYDFTTQRQYTLPKEFQEFSFSNNGAEIAAKVIGARPENNWLVTANADGTGIKFVEPMGENSAKVDVNFSPNGQVVALYAKNTGTDDQEILLIGRNQENFYSLKTLGRGFQGVWTPSGDRLLYSVFSSDNGFRPTLYIADAQGDNVGLNNKNLGINTWPDKCTFADNQTLYCAVPQNLPEGSGIYPEMSKGSLDAFYKIDLKTGSFSQLVVNGDYSVKSLVLSPDQKNLYVVEDGSDALIKISL
jgi:hypothetical protein